MVLFTILSLGLPDLSDWTNNVLPTLVGPAMIVAGYTAIAYGGRRRMREMESGEE